MTRIPW